MDHRNLVGFIDSRCLFSRNDKVLLAVSGGIDSVVLSHLFRQAGLNFAIAHCNFGLRGDESNTDAVFVEQLAQQLKVPFFLKKFRTKAAASDKSISIQMAARELRYSWFEEIRKMHGFTCIATAHHLNDQAETFLINMIRGSGIAGLHGIPVQNERVVRPLMFASRSDIEQYATLHRIEFRNDRSNSETVYLRNKVRHELIPVMCSMNPDFIYGLSQTIRRIHDFEKTGNRMLDEWCRQVTKTEGNDTVIDTSALLGNGPVEPLAWRLLSPFGFNETQVQELLRCLDKPGRKLFQSESHSMVRDRKKIIISLKSATTQINPVMVGPFKTKKQIRKPVSLIFTRIREVTNFSIPPSARSASLDYSKLEFPLTLRKWKSGDSFYPFGMRQRKKLSDFFTDQKFTSKEKEETWLLCSGNAIVWIVGHRIDNRFRITSETREILYVIANNV
jgi:tRNA(Ile)-lysidine synthase